MGCFVNEDALKGEFTLNWPAPLSVGIYDVGNISAVFTLHQKTYNAPTHTLWETSMQHVEHYQCFEHSFELCEHIYSALQRQKEVTSFLVKKLLLKVWDIRIMWINILSHFFGENNGL